MQEEEEKEKEEEEDTNINCLTVRALTVKLDLEDSNPDIFQRYSIHLQQCSRSAVKRSAIKSSF